MIWKLLRKHISVPQLAGFVLANLLGMIVVLIAVQFYYDVMPVFTAEDSFMKGNYVVLNKRIGTSSVMNGKDETFTDDEIEELQNQSFITKLGRFTTSDYKVELMVNGSEFSKGSQLMPISLESVPNEFVPFDSAGQAARPDVIPIILPRSYLAMYNFGIAPNKSLPKMNEGIASMIDFTVIVHGNGKQDRFKGKIVGFSSRLNAVLVPEWFMRWSNSQYAPKENTNPSRLILEVGNPADENVVEFFEKNDYEVEDNTLETEKTVYFLRTIILLVMIVGLMISLLSFYILILSIFLLVQKNSEKLENLLLIGYTPMQVSRPYQLLTIGLNVIVFGVAVVVMLFVRKYYLDIIEVLFPQMDSGSILPSLVIGTLLFLFVSCLNIVIIWRRIRSIL